VVARVKEVGCGRRHRERAAALGQRERRSWRRRGRRGRRDKP